jgi:hypothetical protein
MGCWNGGKTVAVQKTRRIAFRHGRGIALRRGFRTIGRQEMADEAQSADSVASGMMQMQRHLGISVSLTNPNPKAGLDAQVDSPALNVFGLDRRSGRIPIDLWQSRARKRPNPSAAFETFDRGAKQRMARQRLGKRRFKRRAKKLTGEIQPEGEGHRMIGVIVQQHVFFKSGRRKREHRSHRGMEHVRPTIQEG